MSDEYRPPGDRRSSITFRFLIANSRNSTLKTLLTWHSLSSQVFMG